MSYWIAYVVVEGGTVRMAGDTHGYGFLTSLAGGPEAVLDRVAELGPWSYEATHLAPYEGTVLIDRDRRVLAIWAWDVMHAHRHAVLPELRQAWTGYDVCWAYGGAGDIEAYLGHAPGEVTPLYAPGWRPYETMHQPWDEQFFLVTVDDAGYALSMPDEPAELLAGPDEAVTLPDAWRIENLAEWWHRDEPVPLPGLGLHLDTASRIGTGWTVHTIEGVSERWAQAWKGWRWVFDHDRYDRHYARCHDLVRIFLPEPLPGAGWPPLR
ncbi:hypothetical protein [Actinocatenispora rupis]|uniref:Uncharacterized protein n=1 Tax=Actinocatenispora rupis TaxID=519421 RepID=A0A8J3NF83_9ACTN|nr:hypothetical protein [Actinocatenispora rupis]GID14962.1 hypothetical protein Aru02nite_58510 [Actinocatenispora rupis]